MGILTRLIAQRERRSQELTFSLKDPALIDVMGGRPTSTGLRVSEDTALNCAAFYAGVRVLSETFASLPSITYRRLPSGGKERAFNHFLYPLLHDLPNPEITSFEMRETMMAHAVTWGNAYAEIVYNGGGKAVEMWPLTPNRVTPKRLRTGDLVYLVDPVDQAEPRLLERWQVHHVRGLSFNGIKGYNPVNLMRESIGLTLAQEEYAARFFGNDASPGGVLEHPQALSDTAYNRLKAWWAERAEGLSRKHRFAILEDGMKWHQVGVEPEKAQVLQSRKFQVAEIARMLRLPPHMIGDLEKATFSNIEEQAIEFVVYSMLPWVRRWEQAQFRDLIPREDRGTIFTEFLIEGLLRGKVKERYDAYAVGRNWGWLSADDVRELENMNPLPDGQGKVYLSPLNMVSAEDFARDGAEGEKTLEQVIDSLRSFQSELAKIKARRPVNGNATPAE